MTPKSEDRLADQIITLNKGQFMIPCRVPVKVIAAMLPRPENLR